MAGTIDFDTLARGWDSNPVRAALNKALAKGIRNHIDLTPDKVALELGCGTGALAIDLARDLSHVTATDVSREMIDELEAKLADNGMENIAVLRLDLLEASPFGTAAFDMVYTAMALHHIGDVRLLLNRAAELLRPAGTLVVADLVEENGSFHGDADVPHNGFSEERMRIHLSAAGLSVQSFETVHRICKDGRDYPVFMAVAQR